MRDQSLPATLPSNKRASWRRLHLRSSSPRQPPPKASSEWSWSVLPVGWSFRECCRPLRSHSRDIVGRFKHKLVRSKSCFDHVVNECRDVAGHEPVKLSCESFGAPHDGAPGLRRLNRAGSHPPPARFADRPRRASPRAKAARRHSRAHSRR